MDYRYRVKGVVEKAFILRGMHFRIGGEIDSIVLESELPFIKERCNLSEIIDKNEQADNSQSIPTNPKNRKKGENNELPKSASARNKGANKEKV